MRQRDKILIEYKYPDQPWVLYDWTQVPNWADALEMNVRMEYPDAMYRRRKVKA